MDKMLHLKTQLFKDVEQTNDISQKENLKTKVVQKLMTHICMYINIKQKEIIKFKT